MPVDDPNEQEARQIATKQDIRDIQRQVAEYQKRLDRVLFGVDGTNGLIKDIHAIKSEVYGADRGYRGLVTKVDETRGRLEVMEKDVASVRTVARVLALIFGGTVASWIISRWEDLSGLLAAGK